MWMFITGKLLWLRPLPWLTFCLWPLTSFPSISNQRITSVAVNATGEWLAFGCASLGQLLVWEWQSETYVLKQQGHHYDINSLSYSPDGQLIATGGDDGKVCWMVKSLVLWFPCWDCSYVISWIKLVQAQYWGCWSCVAWWKLDSLIVCMLV